MTRPRSASTPGPDPLVSTSGGWVRGIVQTPGVLAFLGIPYAEPPVGARRFRPPEPVRPWWEIRDADRFGPAAAQVFDPHEARLEEIQDGPVTTPPPAHVGSEDCLTLNVWTPAADDARRPVIVFLHGGANWLESSRLRAYHGDSFVRRGDVVFCSINYRLGVFGFLDLSEAGLDGCHSNGLRDQLLALEWIHANIAAFGGDPDNITVMGESAGSMDLSWLLTTGRLEGRIRRAVLMSGVAGVPGLAETSAGSYYTPDMAREQSRELLALPGCRSATELVGLDTATLLERQAAAVPSRDMLFYWDSLFYPRVDGAFIPRTPFAHAQRGGFGGVDLLVGSTGYEAGLWLLWDAGLDQHSPAALCERLPHFPKDRRAEAAALYDRVFAAEPPGVRGMQLVGDAMFVVPGIALAEAHAAAGGRSWLYQFQWEVPDSPLRSTHAADLFFFFDHVRLPGAVDLIGEPKDTADEDERRALAARMQSALIGFARSGDPGWPAYEPSQRQVMLFNRQDAVESDPFRERREWWLRNIYEPVLAR
jgi:para-nitrobenzyl esterase